MPVGTNTIYLIPPRDIPKGRVATYVRIVCADRPERQIQNAFVTLLVAIASIILEAPAPKQQT
jgi:hypothetical protein